MMALCVATLFLSAVLLFSIQPMFAKMALPLLGGTPAVWNTCLVFFQATLLAGYSYAHLSTHRLSRRLQTAVHVGLLLLPLLLGPIGIPTHWRPPTTPNPVLWLLGLLLVAVGLPFFVVSITAPLLQQWFAQTEHPCAHDPYFLYAASNVGSLLALLSYPWLIEPHLRLPDQSRAWRIGYAGLVVLILLCRVMVQRHTPTPREPSAVSEPPALTVGRRCRWALLSFVPSSLLLGLTMYLSTDLAAVPLLWVIPLALYLLTFILVFARRRLLPHRWMVRAFSIVVLPLVICMVSPKTPPIRLAIPLHLLAFFLAAMVCHGELAQDRPAPLHLTAFYFWMSAGGLLGGVFNALVAPLLFTSVSEYPLAIMWACLLRPGAPRAYGPGGPEAPQRRNRWLDYAMPLAVGFWVAAFTRMLHASGIGSPFVKLSLWCVPTALLCYVSRRHPVRFGLSIGAFLFVGLWTTANWERVIHVERSFFGVYRIERIQGPGGPYHRLLHGTTLHGMQSLRPERRHEPLTYYESTGPLGEIFDAFAGPVPRLHRVAVIGLGTGSTGCYASPGQRWTFYEIDPLVLRMSSDPRYFTYLRDCLETFDVVLGDARLSLAGAPDHAYDVMVLDAFSSDAIPTHLLTREALNLYLDKLAPHGIVAFHISNRYLGLEPVLGAIAQAAGLVCGGWKDTKIADAEVERGKNPSHWIVMARSRDDLGPLAAKGSHWNRVQPAPAVAAWTDDFSNIVSVLRWK